MKHKKIITVLLSCLVIGSMVGSFVGCEEETKKTNNSSFMQQENNNMYNPSQFPNNGNDISTPPESSPSILKFVQRQAGDGYSVTGIESLDNKDIIIPEVYNNLPVVEISAKAFSNIGITSVVIPDSVKSMGESAFFRSDYLKSVVIGNSVSSISNKAFQQCYRLESVVIGSSVTSIGESAFSQCGKLTSIIIPDSVQNIGYCAFFSCEKLESVVIGSSVTSIGECAFYSCTALIEIVIPKSVTTIGEMAFAENSNLTKISYEGTMDEWYAISKDSWWSEGIAATEIVCLDGNVKL